MPRHKRPREELDDGRGRLPAVIETVGAQASPLGLDLAAGEEVKFTCPATKLYLGWESAGLGVAFLTTE
jgi:hypothetical protein